MPKEILKKLVNKTDLSKEEIQKAFELILESKVPDSFISAFLIALRMKGETVDEITSCVELLKQKGEKININGEDVIDIVGTGGDGANTFNISTTTSFVVASGGIKVAKHGNRASSSKSGAADILEALGANIYLNPNQNAELLNKIGICFMFAPVFNPLIKNTGKVRKEIGVRTIFNCLGPLINPSGSKNQLIGVYDKNLVEPVIYVLKNLGLKNAMTVFGETGLDEASVISDTYYARLNNGEITSGKFSPEEFNIKRASIEDIKGGSPDENAEIMKNIFNGKIKGAKRDVVCLNSALSFLIVNKVKDVKEGLELANSLIDKGFAQEKLKLFIEQTNEYLR